MSYLFGVAWEASPHCVWELEEWMGSVIFCIVDADPGDIGEYKISFRLLIFLAWAVLYEVIKTYSWIGCNGNL